MSADNYRDCPNCKDTNGLREDYEIFTEYNEIYFVYSCHCRACGYKHKVEHADKFENIVSN
jgi:C4-type Zn-finger protein